jgi:hypothetical protein
MFFDSLSLPKLTVYNRNQVIADKFYAIHLVHSHFLLPKWARY